MPAAKTGIRLGGTPYRPDFPRRAWMKPSVGAVIPHLACRGWQVSGMSGSVTDIVELTCGSSSSVLEEQITERSSHEIQVYRRAAGGIQTHRRKRWAFHGGPANARRVSRRRSEVPNQERAGALRAERAGM